MKKLVISASITPLLEDGSLDKAGLKNIFERNIAHGVDGFFILGSMGEWGSFSDDFKEELVAESCRIIGKRAKLLVGINATSLHLSLKNMERYKKYDFDSFVFMLPARTSSLAPVKSILTVLDASDRPVYYYHVPPNNGHELSLAQFAEIMAHKKLAGIKNSSSNMWLRRELLKLREERGFKTLLLEGQEWAVDEALIVGNDGMVCGMGALASKVMVKLAGAVENGNIAEAVRLQNVMIDVFHGIYGIDLTNVFNGQKYALMKMGLCSTPYTMAQEMSTLTDDAKKRIEAALEALKGELD